MTYQELKDFCNSLPESELSKNVILSREDEVITDIYAEQLEQDYFIETEESENGCFNEDVKNDMIKSNPNFYQNGIEHFEKVYDKGTPILYEKF